MKPRFLGIVTAITFISFQAHGVVNHLGSFISSPEYFNGFEGIGTDQYSGNTYSEGGITVSYVGVFEPHARGVDSSLETAGVWTTWTKQIGGQGNYGWYGPGEGYTSVKLTSGKNIQDIQFLAGSGWGYGRTYMQYELLDDGVIVSSGNFQIDTGNYSTAGWARGEVNTDGVMTYYGLSGGGFDEIRLQNQGFPEGAFAPAIFEAGAYDSIAVVSQGPSAVPEHSLTIILLLLGFSFLGFTRWSLPPKTSMRS